MNAPRALTHGEALSASLVDRGHVRLVVALAGRRGQVVEAVELIAAELQAVGRRVLLDATDTTGARDRGNVVALGKQPGQGGLCRRGTDLRPDGPDLVDDREVPGE